MKASINCIAVIKHYESFYAHPYLCPANVQTIGYGTTIYPDGKKVKLSDPAITEADAIEFLQHDVIQFENDVNSLLKVHVQQCMFDALVSFAYNVGSDIDSDIIAEGLGDSTLLKIINNNVWDAGWKKTISAEFMKWIKATVNGKRKILPGLVARRTTESLLFTDGVVKFFN